MISLAQRLERAKSVVGTLLAGLLLLCAIDAPRSHADAGEWRAAADVVALPPVVQESAVRGINVTARALRIAARDVPFVPPSAFTLDLAAPASSLHATLARVDGPNAIAARGYDATAPPALS